MHMEFNKTMKLRKQDLWTLEEYSTEREDFRRSILEHKKDRQLFLGPNATLYFEDALTMKYQIQEMLRIEKIFESSEIEEEIAAYNPLIPQGSELVATFMFEIDYPITRRKVLSSSLSLSYTKPLHIVRGSGQFLYDKNGIEYLDGVNNIQHVGHAHPKVSTAAYKQLQILNTNTRYLDQHVLDYAERLLKKLPSKLSVCFFTNSGSESNDLALRLARTYT